MAKHTLAAYRAGYLHLWESARVKDKDVARATAAAEKLIALRPRYAALEGRTGVPWFAIAVLHMRECNNNFKGCLHNGQLIIGTGRKTTIVPVGRGPFKTFEDSAVDALRDYQGATWDVPFLAYTCEKFNGFGYRSKGIPSPYLWGGSTVQKRGKYVADHVFDPEVMDAQLGAMTVLRRLCELDADVAARVGASMAAPKPPPKPAPIPPPPDIPKPAPPPVSPARPLWRVLFDLLAALFTKRRG
jgi:lysozyme family protein